MKTTAIRYHDICMGHRVVGHEGKCKNLHGHNYRFWFEIEAGSLDELGRVIDFSLIKNILCEWLELYWDHKMMLWSKDPIIFEIANLTEGVVEVPFNPTAENIAGYFLEKIGPRLLFGINAELISVKLEETRKCSVKVSL